MALSHNVPNPPGEELASPGQNETQRGRKFSAHHHKQSVESSGAGLSFFFKGDLHSPTSTPDSFETQICGKH